MLRSGSGTRAPWSQSWRVGLSPGLGGPSARLGPLRVGESMRERVLGSMRERVLGVSAVWPSVSGRMASGNLAVWPLDSRRVAWPHFTRSRLGLRSSRGRMVCNLPRSLPHTCSRPLVVPHVPSPPPGLRLPLRRASWALSPIVASGYEPRRLAARMRRAVMWIQWG